MPVPIHIETVVAQQEREIASLRAQLAARDRLIAELREALRPFAQRIPEQMPIAVARDLTFEVRTNDLETAARIYAATGADKEGKQDV